VGGCKGATSSLVRRAPLLPERVWISGERQEGGVVSDESCKWAAVRGQPHPSSLGSLSFLGGSGSQERDKNAKLYSRATLLFGACEKAPKGQICPNAFVFKFMTY